MSDCKQYNKWEMRERNLLRLWELTSQDVFLKSESILRQIKESGIISNNSIFMVFHSMKKEFSTTWLIKLLLENRRKVVLPKVINEKDMVVIDIQTGEIFSWNIDVAYIPWVVFWSDYNRIWRWKGYYDRFLADNKIKLKIWVWFDIQLVNNIQVESHDQKMDNIITESFYL